MILSLIGINYKTTSLDMREHIHSLRKKLILFWQSVGSEVAALSTCNRIEFYLAFKNLDMFKSAIDLFKKTFPEIYSSFYLKEGRDELIHHALRLSCGLESQLIGEKEILSQLRSWVSQDSFPHVLKEIWDEALIRAEDIRVKTGLNEIRENISSFVFKDISQYIDLRSQINVLVIGTGKVAQLFSENRLPSCDMYFAARKKHKRALELAKRSKGQAILLDDLASIILKVDVIVGATTSPHHILRKRDLVKVVLKRKRPLYIYDLAVPRDIEPEIKTIKGVFLKGINDLEIYFKVHKENLTYNIRLAEVFINEYVDSFKENIDAEFYKSRYSSEFTCVSAG
ncbi:MAG: hypothetical protein ABH848_06005 [Candidatus Omnitrophota bacterium]